MSAARSEREVPALHPSLWRTARVLANRVRLQVLRHQFQEPGQTVTQVARDLGLKTPLASQALRSLNARGLLQAERQGRWVHYWPEPDASLPASPALLRALQHALVTKHASLNTVIRTVTGFTHPRRNTILRTMRKNACTFEDLRRQTGISARALRRHLLKLQRRRLIVRRADAYVCPSLSRNLLAQTLLSLAQQLR